MGQQTLRRRRAGFAAGLASLVMALGFTTLPADAAPPSRIDYVALGDSYTAGTGAGAAERPPGLDCWQSHPGYVDLLRRTRDVKLLANAACHGSVLSELSPTYDREIYTPTVREQIEFLVKSRALSPETELVSITAGANDLGFSAVLGACAFDSQEACAAIVGRATSPKALSFLTASLIQTYAAIHEAAPSARIAVLGYPLLFDPSSSSAPIPMANQILMNQATLTVNTTIAAAAGTANALYGTDAQYVDLTARFSGHAVNSTVPWLQLDLSDFMADYNFHPNKEGHRAYASAVLENVKSAQLLPQ